MITGREGKAIGRDAPAVAGAANLVIHLGKRFYLFRVAGVVCAGTVASLAYAKLGKAPGFGI